MRETRTCQSNLKRGAEKTDTAQKVSRSKSKNEQCFDKNEIETQFNKLKDTYIVINDWAYIFCSYI